MVTSNPSEPAQPRRLAEAVFWFANVYGILLSPVCLVVFELAAPRLLWVPLILAVLAAAPVFVHGRTAFCITGLLIVLMSCAVVALSVVGLCSGV